METTYILMSYGLAKGEAALRRKIAFPSRSLGTRGKNKRKVRKR
jgi:hypothetical protein